MKTCTKCEVRKDVSEFAWKNKKKGRRSPVCKECMRKYVRNHYANNANEYKRRSFEKNKRHRKEVRQFIWDYLFEHHCVDCGEKNPILLQFDHLRDKKFTIACALRDGIGVKTVLKEIEKCEVRCVRCHTLKTARELGWYKGLAGVAEWQTR